MGLSYGSNSQKQQSQQTTAGTYSPDQSSLQSILGNYLSKLIPSLSSGSMSPSTQAQTTANADKINQNYGEVGDTLQKNLASRGFGKSGQAGDATLQTELARQGAQAGNLEAGASSQLQQNQSSLLDALNYAFTSLGSNSSGSGSSSGSNWGASASAAFSF